MNESSLSLMNVGEKEQQGDVSAPKPPPRLKKIQSKLKNQTS